MTQQHKHKGGVVAATYPPGYFTAKLWPHTNWPHEGWVPVLYTDQQVKRDAWHAALAVNSTLGVVQGKAKTVVLDGSEPRPAMAMQPGTPAYEVLQRVMALRANKARAMPAGKAKP